MNAIERNRISNRFRNNYPYLQKKKLFSSQDHYFLCFIGIASPEHYAKCFKGSEFIKGQTFGKKCGSKYVVSYPAGIFNSNLFVFQIHLTCLENHQRNYQNYRKVRKPNGLAKQICILIPLEYQYFVREFLI